MKQNHQKEKHELGHHLVHEENREKKRNFLVLHLKHV